MVRTEPVDLSLDVIAVRWIRPGDLFPANLEVPANAIFRLGLAVQRDLTRQQRVVRPDSPTLSSMTVTFSLPRQRLGWPSC